MPGYHEHYSVLFELMETRKLLFLLLTIFIDSDESNQGKVVNK